MNSFNKLGESLRAKYPALHNQPNFYQGKKIYALRLLRIRDDNGKINPEYDLHQKEFQPKN